MTKSASDRPANVLPNQPPTALDRILSHARLKQALGDTLVERFGPLPDALKETMVSIGFYFFDRLHKGGKLPLPSNQGLKSVAAYSMRYVLWEMQVRIQPPTSGRRRSLPDFINSSLNASVLSGRGVHHRITDILTIHQALNQLDLAQPELSIVLELKYFWKLTLNETAQELDLSIQQVRTRLQKAETWLRHFMCEKPPNRGTRGTQGHGAPFPPLQGGSKTEVGG